MPTGRYACHAGLSAPPIKEVAAAAKQLAGWEHSIRWPLINPRCAPLSVAGALCGRACPRGA
jgi:hypothetical protein